MRCDRFLELLKALLYGAVEGVTEWLPISSTGHLILLERLVPLDLSEDFSEMFRVVIQLGAVLAVAILYFRRLNPLAPSKTPAERRRTGGLWLRVLAAVVPSGVVGLLLDDWLDRRLYNAVTVAAMLVLYGVAFLLVERFLPRNRTLTESAEGVGFRTALLIGLFQTLALVPGTSRSGATILGGLLLGLSRPAAAEFSFFMALPTMAGASLVKIAGFAARGVSARGVEWAILAVACAAALAVSMATIRVLMGFIKRHTFSPFGAYRIALGGLVLLSLLF